MLAKKVTLLLILFSLGLAACSSRSKQLQPEEVPASAPDPFVKDVDQNDPFLAPEARSSQVLHFGEWGDGPPLAVYQASMFNSERRTSANPLLVKFDATGAVDSIRRLMVVIGTADEIDKKRAELEPEQRHIELMFMNVKAKKLDMHKADDRISLIQETIQEYGENKAREMGVRIYDGSWKLRYRWPAKEANP